MPDNLKPLLGAHLGGNIHYNRLIPRKNTLHTYEHGMGGT